MTDTADTIAPEIRMINDIAVQFPHQEPGTAATAIAAHVRMFWEPRMRAELRKLSDTEPEAFEPLALAAARLLE
ncbi:formate dehydrogenase [Prauserella marina]|uniref:Formate dehydrogenase subunit delta n=1 Tax=Prauserella marina TaxID=530584 RepID=A0A222VXV0_9PSEU|nr:formate dehydrogenase subunit delta [Prauserella marina]ASR38503.1 formate dehydrogenase [Prauserella marina]PWV81798.1 formate dehydrogenase subunit delta [Prauserella marina]SDD12550.1 formate dehydrogenase subunit delta [Prauserella marina]